MWQVCVRNVLGGFVEWRQTKRRRRGFSSDFVRGPLGKNFKLDVRIWKVSRGMGALTPELIAQGAKPNLLRRWARHGRFPGVRYCDSIPFSRLTNMNHHSTSERC